MCHPTKSNSSAASLSADSSPSLQREQIPSPDHHPINEEEPQHDPAFRRPNSFYQHDRRDRVSAAAGVLPGAYRAADDEHARPYLLAEPGRGHRLSVAP